MRWSRIARRSCAARAWVRPRRRARWWRTWCGSARRRSCSTPTGSTPSPAAPSCATARDPPSSRTARPATRSRRGRARRASSRATSSPSCPRPSSACRRRPVPRRRAGEATVRGREVTTHTPEETEALGEAFGRAARGGELIGLVGELGAGKTCLVRGLARGLGIDPERVHSPSFTIVTEYPGGRLPLAHVDLYRLDA